MGLVKQVTNRVGRDYLVSTVPKKMRDLVVGEKKRRQMMKGIGADSTSGFVRTKVDVCAQSAIYTLRPRHLRLYINWTFGQDMEAAHTLACNWLEQATVQALYGDGCERYYMQKGFYSVAEERFVLRHLGRRPNVFLIATSTD